jgi:hypothetical protein
MRFGLLAPSVLKTLPGLRIWICGSLILKWRYPEIGHTKELAGVQEK